MTFLQNDPIKLKLGTQQLLRLGNLILDTVLTSELFGTTRPTPNYDLFTESCDQAETWYIAAFEVGESYSGQRFDL